MLGDAMTTSHTAPRFGLGRFRQPWAALAAVLVLTLCCPQQGAAQATIQVTTTQQGVTAGQCSLQEAIYASEFNGPIAISSTNPDVTYTTGCTAGGGEGDIIVLAPGALYAFDHSWDGDAHNAYGPTATPIIFRKITIEGNGATLQWFDRFRPAISRLFAIGTVNDPNFPSGTGNLTLRNVYIKGFHIKGGDGGAGGGGGGLGAGGAIYVHEGVLNVENSTFENNGAVGGNGGISTGLTSGGGGGLSGNGGDGCPTTGGGGGGSRGNGGKGISVNFVGCILGGGGGGGGGTVLSGKDGGPGGFRCGGTGGAVGSDGQNAACPGGGGGGGGGGGLDDVCFSWNWCTGNGAPGGYGGGGGGGVGDGGQGGFGGGGGGGFTAFFSLHGGNGGFGGGGGSAPVDCYCLFSGHPGKGGPFGGRADAKYGGGGGALGGAIFSHNSAVEVRNSTFFNNFVTRGNRGGEGSAANGADAGGAIFALGKSVEITDSTFSGNQATGSGAAIVVYRDDAPVNFVLNNNIIANNGAFECFFTGSVTAKGAGNLIMQNGPGTGPFSPCPGVVTTSDPQLQSLQLNSPGNTPTMAIPATSSALDSADPNTSLSTDQRGVARPQGAGFDIGAFEARSEDLVTTWNPSDKGTNVTLSNGNLTFVAGWLAYDGVRAVASASVGKKYWELTATRITTQASSIVEGIANNSLSVNGPVFLGGDSNGIGWAGDGNVWINNAVVATIQGWSQGDVLSFAVDLGSNMIWFRTNAGNWNNDAANDPATNTGGIDISTLAGGPYFAFGQGGNSGQGDALTANFGGSAYTQSVPSGFSNW
jgi:hypothetical protein